MSNLTTDTRTDGHTDRPSSLPLLMLVQNIWYTYLFWSEVSPSARV